MQDRNRYSRIGFAATMLVLVFNVSNSFAQSRQMLGQIPFDFYVDSTLMPAGTYYVQPLTSSVVQISNRNGNSTIVMTLGTTNRHPEKSRLVFHRYGTMSFLSELYWEGYNVGRALQPSKIERAAIQGKDAASIELAAARKK
jgi:hypothetical protein